VSAARLPNGRPAAILIGPPGAGKSTVGPLLAARLAVGFVDTDASVEAVAGKPVGDIFLDDGEPAFRALERAAVAAALTGHDGVVSVGGGAVLDQGTRELLDGLDVVYLETGFTEAARRVGLDSPRPLMLGNPRARLKELLGERLPIYQQLARITVLTDGRSPEELAGQIATQLTAGGDGVPGDDEAAGGDRGGAGQA
jgi:shikimate kinase